MNKLLNVESVLFYIVIVCYFAATLLYFLFIALKKDSVTKAAILVQTVGFALHTAALICRGLGGSSGNGSVGLRIIQIIGIADTTAGVVTGNHVTAIIQNLQFTKECTVVHV